MSAWEQVLAIGVPGDPMPAPRYQRTKTGREYMPSKYLAHRDALAMQIRLRRAPGSWPDRTSRFFVKVLAFRETLRRVDVDNILKTCLDAGTVARLWADDSQVVKACVSRLLDRERPRVEIRVWRMVAEQQELATG